MACRTGTWPSSTRRWPRAAIALPGLAGTEEDAFSWAFAAWTLAAAVAVVLLCGALARATGGGVRRAMLAAALMPVACGALLRTHFDLFPVALLLAGLLLLCRDRPRAGLAVLALGAMTKGFPLLAVPVALAWLVARGLRREAWQGALACVAVMAVVGGAALAASPDGALDAVRYHLDRPVQVESSQALVLLGLDAVGLGEAQSVASHRSDGLEHPADDALTALFATALVALAALLCAGVARTTTRLSKRRERGVAELSRYGNEFVSTPRPSGAEWRVVDQGGADLLIASLSACVAFALLGKVLSPAIRDLGAAARSPGPRLADAHPRRRRCARGTPTHIEFPAHYFDVVAREPAAIGLVALRNLALLAVLVLGVRALRPRRQEQLLDRGRAALAVHVD